MTGVLMPSALSKLTMLSTSRRLLAPREVDLSFNLALISVFLLLAYTITVCSPEPCRQVGNHMSNDMQLSLVQRLQYVECILISCLSRGCSVQ